MAYLASYLRMTSYSSMNVWRGLALILLFASISIVQASASPPTVTGKTPIIVIPGITGSELHDKKTGKQVWFTRSRSKGNDIRLPISPNFWQVDDELEARDIIRSVRIARFIPEVEIYERLIEGLKNRGGYREVKFSEAGPGDHEDTFFVFPYDWRRDNVETARLLVRRVEELRKRLGKPAQKFNIIAHSMGGLVSRYAAMYGDSDIPGGTLRPTWAGAAYFDKIFLLGTPNEGSVSALKALLEGYSYIGGGINLPFVRDISNVDVFTIPSAYQLLPHEGSLLVYNEELKPVPLDIFEPRTWQEYGWDIWNGKSFAKNFTPAEQNNALPFFTAVLKRAKRFQDAINANTNPNVPVSFYLIGGDCKETQNGFILRRNENKDKWVTQFNASAFTAPDGKRITSEMIKPLIYSEGDSVVTKRSLTADSLSKKHGAHVLPLAGEIFQCETHGKLVTNPEIQDKLFLLLGAVRVE